MWHRLEAQYAGGWADWAGLPEMVGFREKEKKSQRQRNSSELMQVMIMKARQ